MALADGRTRGPPPDPARPPLRRTDTESGTASSVFKLVGAGQVGVGSVRGMVALAALAAAGFHVWPFAGEVVEPSVLVLEIYPRLLLDRPVVKSDAAARRQVPQGRRPLREHREAAADTDAAFDAAVSAVAMADHLDELRRLPAAPDYAREGAIWRPGFALTS